MPRKPTGETRWSPEQNSFMGRIRLDTLEGKRGPWVVLGTRDPKIAKEKTAIWAQGGPAPVGEKGRETFKAAAERVMDKQEKKGFKGIGSRRHRVRSFAIPVIGHILVRDLTAGNVNTVLTEMTETRQQLVDEVTRWGAEQVSEDRGIGLNTLQRWAAGAKSEGFLFDTVHHLRTDISRILTALVVEDELLVNVAEGVEIPEDAAIDERRRMVLSDEQYVLFMKRGFEGEVEMMALLSRCLAGGRPSDWADMTYGKIDFVKWLAQVRRPKTDGDGPRKRRRKGARKGRLKVVFEDVWLPIKEICRAPLTAWRDKAAAAGRAGPRDYVFPVTKGPRAGEKKREGMSLARRFRALVWLEGIHDWMVDEPGFAEAVGDERKKFDRLQTDTDDTRALDFYSNRRAFIGALRAAGVGQQDAMLSAGHTNPYTHAGYNPRGTVVDLPDAMLPGGKSSLGSDENKQGPQQPPISPSPSDAVAVLTAALAGLAAQLAALQPRLPQGGGFDPASGSNAPPSLGQTPSQVPEKKGRAQSDSNTRPLAPEAGGNVETPRKDPHTSDSVVAGMSPSEGGLTQGLGQTISPVLSLDAARKKRAGGK